MHKLIAASSGGEGNPFQEVDKRALSPEGESTAWFLFRSKALQRKRNVMPANQGG